MKLAELKKLIKEEIGKILQERNWRLTIDVKSIWKNFEDLDNKDIRRFREAQKLITSVLEKHKIQIERIFGTTIHEDYEEYVEELKNINSLEGFNRIWNNFYDFADKVGIWIVTGI